MSWDKKGKSGRLYYYRYGVNGAGNQGKVYVGRGEKGRQAAEEDAEKRRAAAEMQTEWQHLWRRVETASRMVHEHRDWSRLLMHGILILAGYHQHARSEWRLRRKKHG
jgi:hypothetical protein